MALTPPSSFSPSAERTRVSIELAPVISSLVDHISEVTGVSKAQVINGALLDALPVLLSRADGFKKRYSELAQSKGRK